MAVKVKLSRPDLPRNFFSLFKKDALLLANTQNKKFAREAVRELKEVIRKQKYDWEPLTEGYAKYKERKGLDKRILIATGDYVKRGIVMRVSSGFVFVGPKEGTHEPSGLPYEVLAKIHEYGTKDGRIPARPLYRPVLSVLLRRRRTFRKVYDEGVKKALMRRLRAAKKRKKTTVAK